MGITDSLGCSSLSLSVLKTASSSERSTGGTLDDLGVEDSRRKILECLLSGTVGLSGGYRN